MKVALVHDWLNGMRGGEKILEVLAEIFPSADVYTLLYQPEKICGAINRLNVHTSFVQKLPFVRKYYRYYLPIFPKAIESFKLEGYDLVISTSHCVAKGIVAPKNACNICYCLTPIRYVWDFGRDYFGFKRFLLMPFLNRIKTWDQKTSSRPQYYISISQTVANRVKRYYNKESAIVYPPVDADFFMPQDKDGDFYLVVSALVPYKRIDLAVEAFNELGLPLKIIGTGTDFKHLQKKARPNIQFLGWQSDEAVRDYYARCKALIFPGIEDFGITVLEAQACGRPVIAFSAGGALETVDEKIPTGVFFNEQTAESLVNTIKEFEKKKHLFNKQKTREHILQFDRKLFKQRLKDEIQGLFNLHNNSKNSK